MSVLIPTLEKPVEPVDVLVALGKNIGVGSSPTDIRATPDHLSPESRMIARAAGYLYRPDMTLIFSTGQTAGEDTPAESDAMWDYVRPRFPGIPSKRVIREIRSLHTPGNAEEVAQLLIERGLHAKRIGLLTVGHHKKGAVRLFEGRGVNISQAFAAEDVLMEYEPSSKDDIEAWARSRRVKLERVKEGIRGALLSTVDPRGGILSWFTEHTRG